MNHHKQVELPPAIRQRAWHVAPAYTHAYVCQILHPRPIPRPRTRSGDVGEEVAADFRRDDVADVLGLAIFQALEGDAHALMVVAAECWPAGIPGIDGGVNCSKERTPLDVSARDIGARRAWLQAPSTAHSAQLGARSSHARTLACRCARPHPA